MKKERPRNDITLGVHAKFFRGLADPARLGILLCLRTGSLSAGELARGCGLSPSNASNHLRCLLECGLVNVQPQGRQNLYRLADPQVALLLDTSDRLMCSRVGSLVGACGNYGAGSRRALRTSVRSGRRPTAAASPRGRPSGKQLRKRRVSQKG